MKLIILILVSCFFQIGFSNCVVNSDCKNNGLCIKGQCSCLYSYTGSHCELIKCHSKCGEYCFGPGENDCLIKISEKNVILKEKRGGSSPTPTPPLILNSCQCIFSCNSIQRALRNQTVCGIGSVQVYPNLVASSSDYLVQSWSSHGCCPYSNALNTPINIYEEWVDHC